MGCDDEHGRVVVRHKKGREMSLENELNDMMQELNNIKETYGLRGISVSDHSVTIHGTDEKGDYVMSNPAPGTAIGCLFGGYRFYGGEE